MTTSHWIREQLAERENLEPRERIKSSLIWAVGGCTRSSGKSTVAAGLVLLLKRMGHRVRVIGPYLDLKERKPNSLIGDYNDTVADGAWQQFSTYLNSRFIDAIAQVIGNFVPGLSNNSHYNEHMVFDLGGSITDISLDIFLSADGQIIVAEKSQKATQDVIAYYNACILRLVKSLLSEDEASVLHLVRCASRGLAYPLNSRTLKTLLALLPTDKQQKLAKLLSNFNPMIVVNKYISTQSEHQEGAKDSDEELGRMLRKCTVPFDSKSASLLKGLEKLFIVQSDHVDSMLVTESIIDRLLSKFQFQYDPKSRHPGLELLDQKGLLSLNKIGNPIFEMNYDIMKN
jgi:hypothetical protein